MSSIEQSPVPEYREISHRKANLVGMTVLGGVFIVGYGATAMIPFSETPSQDDVRACAELLDAPQLDVSAINTKCNSDAIINKTTTAPDESRVTSTEFPTGNQYISIFMPKAVEHDANKPAYEDVLTRSFGGALLSLSVLFTSFGYVYYKEHPDEFKIVNNASA